MNLKKVTIDMDAEQVQEILAIDMDDDAERALGFIKTRLANRVKKCLQPHCVPVFEVTYGPGQKDRFSD